MDGLPTLTNSAECELKALELNLLQIKTNTPITNKKVIIFSDSLTSLKYLNMSSYPRYNDTKTIIENLFNILCDIQTKDSEIHIIFAKIKAHSDFKGNETIDKLVRNEARNQIYDPAKNLHIQYPMSLSILYKEISTVKLTDWINRKNKHTLLYHFNKKWDPKINTLFASYSRNDAAILVRLLTGHIGLNEYYHRFGYTKEKVLRIQAQIDKHNYEFENPIKISTNKDAIAGSHIDSMVINHPNLPTIPTNIQLYQSDMKCPDFAQLVEETILQMPIEIREQLQPKFCTNCVLGVTEDVPHFLLHCTAYNTQRQQLKDRLQRTNPNFKNPTYFATIKNTIFPYKNKSNTIKQNYLIWKHIIKFIRATKRIRNYYNPFKSYPNEPHIEPTNIPTDQSNKRRHIDAFNDSCVQPIPTHLRPIPPLIPPNNQHNTNQNIQPIDNSENVAEMSFDDFVMKYADSTDEDNNNDTFDTKSNASDDKVVLDMNFDPSYISSLVRDNAGSNPFIPDNLALSELDKLMLEINDPKNEEIMDLSHISNPQNYLDREDEKAEEISTNDLFYGTNSNETRISQNKKPRKPRPKS